MVVIVVMVMLRVIGQKVHFLVGFFVAHFVHLQDGLE